MPDRFFKINNHLYRGGEPSKSDLLNLTLKGIRNIISLDDRIGNKIHSQCKQLGLLHVILPLEDGNGPNIDRIATLVKFIATLGPTYIHCRHGKDRTGLVCAVYRVLIDGWEDKKALTEAAKIGMGKGLSPDSAKSYYDAFYKIIINEDDANNSDDIVGSSRDMSIIQPSPGINNQSAPSFINSFAPYLDGENDYLNMPADDSNDVPMVGLHDNYTGLAPFSFPGNSGAGIIITPFNKDV